MNERKSLFWQEVGFTLRAMLRSAVAKNAASLYVIQFANYALPLITVPYLVRVLGPAGYGTVAFGQSFITFFTLFVDYGFALSATRKISVNRNDILTVSRTAVDVWAAKVFLCIVGFAILLLITRSIPKLREVSLLLIVLYGLVMGNVLFPTWIFQGMEKMVTISVINLTVRIFFVIGIFTMVHRPQDYIIYAGLTSLSSIGAGIVGVLAAFLQFRLRVVMPSWRGALSTLREGWILFLSMASVSLYTAGNAFILGLLTSPTIVGYYSAAEKITRAVIGLFTPISQAVYPRFNKLAQESRSNALQWGQRLLFVTGGVGLFLSVAILIGAPLIVHAVLGVAFAPSVAVMRILAFFIFINAITNIWGIQIMLSFGHDKAFTSILFGAGVINILLALLMIPLWRERGMAAAVLISGIFIAITQVSYLYVHQLFPAGRLRSVEGLS